VSYLAKYLPKCATPEPIPLTAPAPAPAR
jgi:hypothetical protein